VRTTLTRHARPCAGARADARRAVTIALGALYLSAALLGLVGIMRPKWEAIWLKALAWYLIALAVFTVVVSRALHSCGLIPRPLCLPLAIMDGRSSNPGCINDLDAVATRTRQL
jgi:hypothetical protein